MAEVTYDSMLRARQLCRLLHASQGQLGSNCSVISKGMFYTEGPQMLFSELLNSLRWTVTNESSAYTCAVVDIVCCKQASG